MRMLHIRGGPLLFAAALLLGVSAIGWCENAPTDAIGREITIYAAVPDTGPTDAIGREMTLYVATPDPGPTDAIGREITLFIPAPDPPPGDAIGRELTLFVQPYVTSDAIQALRIAGGLFKPTDPADAAALISRLDVAQPLGKVQVQDAAKVLRLALKLDP